MPLRFPVWYPPASRRRTPPRRRRRRPTATTTTWHWQRGKPPIGRKGQKRERREEEKEAKSEGEMKEGGASPRTLRWGAWLYTGDGAFWRRQESPLRLWLKSSESRVTPDEAVLPGREQFTAVEIAVYTRYVYTHARPCIYKYSLGATLASFATGWDGVTREP